MDEIIKTEGLCRDYKSGSQIIHAVREVGVSINKGYLTILKGRSGSGKTTLMNLLGAIDRPTRGRVYFEGRDITELPDRERDDLRRRKIGFVFQSGALVSNISAYENVEFGLRLAGFNKKEMKETTQECLRLVGLSQRMRHYPYELSGGEAQRVAIARAIAHRPEVIFADEPTSALDTTMGLQVVKTFKSLVEKEGITVVMTTHDPNMMEVADFIYSMQDGEIIDE
jgi:putative ABC transport system ATP-binding protein